MSPGLACVTGRFQPVHLQHVELFELALRPGGRLVVAITDPDPGARRPEPDAGHRHTPAANPFTYFERAGLVATALAGRGLLERATIVPFDLTRPQHWPLYVPLAARHLVRAFGAWERRKAERLAAAGYAVTVIDGDPAAKLSATEVRRRLAAGQGWTEAVPAATVPLLRALLEERSMAARTAAA